MENFRFLKRYKNRFYREKIKSVDKYDLNDSLLKQAFSNLTERYIHQENLETNNSDDNELSRPIQEYEVKNAIKKAKKKKKK